MLPQIKEFERVSTTVVNAYVGPILKQYLGKLHHLKNNRSFQLFGVDYMITNDLHPFLLEINKGPEMKPKDYRDRIMKTKLNKDMLNVVNMIELDNINQFQKIA